MLFQWERGDQVTLGVVTLAGVDSAICNRMKRVFAWRQLVPELDFKNLESMINLFSLEHLIRFTEGTQEGKTRGGVITPVSK